MNSTIRLFNRVYFSLLLFCLLSAQAFTIQARDLVGIKLDNANLMITLSDAELRIRAINKATVEVFYQASNTKQLPSFALPENTITYTNVKLKKTNTGFTFTLPKLTVNIQSEPFKLSFSNKNGLLSTEEAGLFHYDSLRGFRFELSEDEQIMGGGQRVMGMDRRNQRMPLYNKAHYGYSNQSEQMYFGLSAIMSTKGYVIAFDNSASGYLDIGYTEKNVLQFEAEAGRTSYLFSSGETPRKLIQNFVSATGKQALPPRWALGNFASRFGYKSQQQVLDTIALFERQDFPVDAVVLDLYWFGADIKGHMGNLNWDQNNWPDPEKMIKTLADKGVKTIVITEPFILTSSSEWESAVNNNALSMNLAGKPKRFDFYFGNTGLVDVFSLQAQDWFWQYYNKLNLQGVAGWWGDLGEPEVHPSDSVHKLDGVLVSADEIHNAYGHKWAQMLYERQLKARPNERPFIMMRSGFLGSQRYGMLPWTGDVERSWGGLQSQVELALQMGLFGLAYTHSDLGGFAGGETFDAELYTRWLQYGVFQPVYRPHAQDHIPPEPVFHDELTQNIVREYVKLRYRLLPYNYSLSMQNALSGLPMMRPLFLDYPKQSITRTDAYLWGDAFLIAPIIEQGQSSISTPLPEGVWFNFWNDRIYKGNTTQVIDAPLEQLPILVKAGSFVPMTNVTRNLRGYTSKKLTVHYYAHQDKHTSSYSMFEDDGVSPNSIQEKAYQEIVFSANSAKNTQSKALALNIHAEVKGHYVSAPDRRNIEFIIHNIVNQPQQVTVNGKNVTFAKTQKNMIEDQAYFDSNKHILHVGASLQSSLSITIN